MPKVRFKVQAGLHRERWTVSASWTSWSHRGDQGRQNQKGQKANQDEGQHMTSTVSKAEWCGGRKRGDSAHGLGVDVGSGRNLMEKVGFRRPS